MSTSFKSVDLLDGRIIIRFSHSSYPVFKHTLDVLKKNIIGRYYLKNLKAWTCPPLLYNYRLLKDMGFTISKEVKDYLKSLYEVKIDSNIKIPLDFDYYPFQREGISFVENKDGRAIITFDMGCGKTMISIGWCSLHPERIPILVVCPASVKTNWELWFNKLMPNLKTQILSGRIYKEKLEGDVIIINYDILAFNEDDKISHNSNICKLLDYIPEVLLIDECHYTKTPTALRTKAVIELMKQTPYVIGLSGTPIEKKPIEFLTFLKYLKPEIFNNKTALMFRYCDPKEVFIGYDHKRKQPKFALQCKGASNKKEFHELLSKSVMIRRKKEDVLDQLPSITRIPIPLEISNRKEYNKIEEDTTLHFGGMERLQQLVLEGKLDSCIEWIQDFLDSCDEKLIVYTRHHNTLDYVINHFKKIAVQFDGRTSLKNKDIAKKQFIEDPKIRLFVGNIIAAGTGVDGLQEVCSKGCFLELIRNPKKIEQAEDRIHRIGTKNPVFWYYLIAYDTIEQDILESLDIERKNVDEILDGEEVNSDKTLYKIFEKRVERRKKNVK